MRSFHPETLGDSLVLVDKRGLDLMFLHSSLDDFGLSPIEFRIYAHLVRRSNGKGMAWPSSDSIATTCKIHKDSVWPAIKTLVSYGLITRITRLGTSNAYRLNAETDWVKPAEVAGALEKEGRPSDSSGGALEKEGCKGNPIEGNPISTSFLQKEPLDLKAKSGKKPTPPKSPPHPDHAPFIKWWCEGFLHRWGIEYVFDGGRDGRAVKFLCSLGLGLDGLKGIVLRCWDGEGGWSCGKLDCLSWLSNHINQIRAELADSGAPQARSGAGSNGSDWARVKYLEPLKAKLEKDVARMDDDWSKIYLRVEPLKSQRFNAKSELITVTKELSDLHAKIGGKR